MPTESRTIRRARGIGLTLSFRGCEAEPDPKGRAEGVETHEHRCVRRGRNRAAPIWTPYGHGFRRFAPPFGSGSASQPRNYKRGRSLPHHPGVRSVKVERGGEKRASVVGFRPRENLLGRTILHHFAVLHHDDVV